MAIELTSMEKAVLQSLNEYYGRRLNLVTNKTITTSGKVTTDDEILEVLVGLEEIGLAKHEAAVGEHKWWILTNAGKLEMEKLCTTRKR